MLSIIYHNRAKNSEILPDENVQSLFEIKHYPVQIPGAENEVSVTEPRGKEGSTIIGVIVYSRKSKHLDPERYRGR